VFSHAQTFSFHSLHRFDLRHRKCTAQVRQRRGQIGWVDAERYCDGTGGQIGRVDGERIYDATGRQIGCTDGLRRRQIILFFTFICDWKKIFERTTTFKKLELHYFHWFLTNRPI
jgi:hypothetical protein